MKVLVKKHWLLFVVGIIWVFCIVDFRWLGMSDEEAMNMGVWFFGILMPICSFVLSLWYGYRLRDSRKWLIVIACGIVGLLIIIVSTGNYKFWTYWQMGVWILVPALVGMLIGSGVWKLSHEW